MLNNKIVLITGGTGSFGKKCTEMILSRYKPKKLIIFSRDELKQYEMAQIYSDHKFPCIRYFLGDVRDKERLHRAFQGVDYIIHTAALKQIPSTEYNPFEAVKTNIIGASNIINAAIDQKVQKVIALSTDKAVNPINLYGATKLCSDKLFIAGNVYSGDVRTKFSVVRYGNVICSRGSVIPFFNKIKKEGFLPITDIRMTRFWISLEQGVNFVLKSFELMEGGEIFIPKLPSMKIINLANVICPHCEKKIVGIRPGEKVHEVLISKDEARNTIEMDDYFIVKPCIHFFNSSLDETNEKKTQADFEYSSNNNSWWLEENDLQMLMTKEND